MHVGDEDHVGTSERAGVDVVVPPEVRHTISEGRVGHDPDPAQLDEHAGVAEPRERRRHLGGLVTAPRGSVVGQQLVRLHRRIVGGEPARPRAGLPRHLLWGAPRSASTGVARPKRSDAAMTEESPPPTAPAGAPEVPEGWSWHKVVDPGEVDDGRVRTAHAGPRTIALARCGDRFGALDNRCPHQGGPLGEGSIENGLLRCPWHGYDYDPVTGPPAGRVQRCARGVPGRGARRRRLRGRAPAARPRAHGLRRHGRDDGGVGRDPCVRDGRPLQPGLRRRPPARRAAGRDDLHRHPPRGGGRLRRLGLRQAHRAPGRLLRHRRPRLHQPADRALRRQGRPGAGARRSPGRCRRRCSGGARSRTST